MKCKECGQDRPKPAQGAKVMNRYRECLGVVVTDVKTTQTDQVHVVVLTGVHAGLHQNWYLSNIDVVHGTFHINGRKAAL